MTTRSARSGGCRAYDARISGCSGQLVEVLLVDVDEGEVDAGDRRRRRRLEARPVDDLAHDAPRMAVGPVVGPEDDELGWSGGDRSPTGDVRRAARPPPPGLEARVNPSRLDVVEQGARRGRRGRPSRRREVSVACPRACPRGLTVTAACRSVDDETVAGASRQEPPDRCSSMMSWTAGVTSPASTTHHVEDGPAPPSCRTLISGSAAPDGQVAPKVPAPRRGPGPDELGGVKSQSTRC